MAKATVQSLNERERVLLAETQPKRLKELDEDALLNLHARLRRERDKVVQQHRREVGAHVDATRARGKASDAPRRSAGKAELFEAALARVSTAVAKAARMAAAELRAERLAAATPAGATRRPTKPAATTEARATRAATSTKRTPASRKKVASTRAQGARNQARRDAR